MQDPPILPDKATALSTADYTDAGKFADAVGNVFKNGFAYSFSVPIPSATDGTQWIVFQSFGKF